MKLIEDIIYNNNVESILSQAINHIYTNGPISTTDMEVLSYISIYQPDLFSKYLSTIINYLAIFYKKPKVNTLQEFNNTKNISKRLTMCHILPSKLVLQLIY